MTRLLLPLLIVLIGLGAGVGAGIALRPAPTEEPQAGGEMAEANPCGDIAPTAAPKSEPAPPHEASDFVKLSNQFVFPLIEEGEVAALVVLSLTLEVAPGQGDAVYQREPKLRDGFLRVLLDHANAGGFKGAFTSNQTMESLRRALLEKGREDLGDALYDILILDINRQDT
ncbi:flagellar basal body-associated FliL family protein [Oceaniglobus trochenteri]|uniref:flagellar basal body-associated FliL family protein n=1 Tax=Oceaniglobus trochenteri TaxID=2763260 RepID=UPI001CFF932C|nr:flagellar basal body-associated FliL family protein [Oceaniglobus trochenteri]